MEKIRGNIARKEQKRQSEEVLKIHWRSKRKMKKSVGSLLSMKAELIMTGNQVEVLNTCFISLFTKKVNHHQMVSAILTTKEREHL